MPVTEESGLIVEIPSAESLVGDLRQRYDPAAAAGVPAHVTVLYPFVKPDQIDRATLTELLDAIGDEPPFRVSFRTTGTFPAGVVWLRPEPDDGFRSLTRRVSEAFPDHPPYSGDHEDPQPHLTVAQTLPGSAGEELRDALDTSLAKRVIAARITEVALYTRATDGRWTRRAGFPLGTAS